LLKVVGSYVEDGSVDLDRARQEPETQSDLFTITCWQCNQDFIPLPPNAACPNCGWTAVTVA
jgi:Zn finger protein HypA/HybF involved in hydrogenase expression